MSNFHNFAFDVFLIVHQEDQLLDVFLRFFSEVRTSSVTAHKIIGVNSSLVVIFVRSNGFKKFWAFVDVFEKIRVRRRSGII